MATVLNRIMLILGMMGQTVAAFCLEGVPSEDQLRDTVSLNFVLTASKETSLIFVGGYPLPSSITDPRDHYRNLSVRISAKVRVLQNGLVRFTFGSPLQIKTKNLEGRESTLVYRSVDVRLTTESRAALDWMRGLKVESVLVDRRESDSRDQRFDEVLNQSPSETLKRLLEGGQRMSGLYRYDGDISLGYIRFDTFSMGEATDAEITRVELKKITGFDRQRNTIFTAEGGTSIPFSIVSGYGQLSIFDHRVNRVLEVQQYVDKAMERAAPFRISYRTVEGRRTIVLHRGKKDGNVARPVFGGVVRDCSAAFRVN